MPKYEQVKAWKLQMHPPENFKEMQETNEKPCVNLTLNYVYGYRAKDMRNNIKEINDHLIAYPVSNLIVLLNTAQNTQQLFKRHTNLVSCIGIILFPLTNSVAPK